jgi:tetratricopeptide (TPR) repeat protein
MSAAPHRSSRHPRHAPAPHRHWLPWGTALLALIALALCWWYLRTPPPSSPAQPPASPSAASAANPDIAKVNFFQLAPEKEVFAQYGGSESCRECHAEAYEHWRRSNHALAERPVDPARDRPAFDPPRAFHHGTQFTGVRYENGRFEVRTPGPTNHGPFVVERVIGNFPLLQYLTPFPGGRWQTLEASYDPVSNEWFNVFGQEDRQPGEWGHWSGRGMNWNSMCAGCHNTRLRKNYDARTDAYRTTMAEMSVGCEACHGPMKDHNEWQYQHKGSGLPDPTLRKPTRQQTLHTCAFCHARRMDLTGDFKPGDNFWDHFMLQIVDQTDIFYPDGQIRDEDYEFAPFLGSRMHAQGGVTCADCHHPHTMKPLLPGNLLCARCHEGSHTNAPIIDPVKHSFHKVFNPFVNTNGELVEVDLNTTDFKNIKETGGQCVNCHMPQTPFMQRHWRHDHGWTIPDPLLTKQFGIPNACNRCHTTNTVDWAIEWVDKWYGEKMNRPYRQRAQTAARAQRGDPAARGPLLEMLARDPIPYWRAAAANLLDPWVNDPAVLNALLRQLSDTNELVRAHVAQALGGVMRHGGPAPPAVENALRAALQDPIRAVRFQAASALRGRLDPNAPVTREYLHALQFNADQPAGQMQLGLYHLARNDSAQAAAHFQKAVEWDPRSPAIRHEYAVILSQTGQILEAVRQLREAVRLAPNDAEMHYKLALALNEAGDLPACAAELENAVRLDPNHHRAWYNLGLARHGLGDPAAAVDALRRAEALSPNDPRIPYAAATIFARMQRWPDARAAARRALTINPNDPETARLVQYLESQR